MLEFLHADAMPTAAWILHLAGLAISVLLVVYVIGLARSKHYLPMVWGVICATLLIVVNLGLSSLLPTPAPDSSLRATGVIWYDAAFRADFGLALLILAIVIGVAWSQSALHRPADRAWQAANISRAVYVRTGITALFALLPLLIWGWGMVMWSTWTLPFLGGIGLMALAGAITNYTEGSRRWTLLLMLAAIIVVVQSQVNARLNASAESMFDPTGAVPVTIPLIPVVLGALLVSVVRTGVANRTFAGLNVRVGAILWLLVLVGFIIRFMGHYDHEGSYGFYAGALLELPLRLFVDLVSLGYYGVVPRELAADANFTSIYNWNAIVITLLTVGSGLLFASSLRRKPARLSRPDGLHLTLQQRRYVLAFVLIAPALLLRLFTTLYPFAQTSLLSLQRYNPAFPPQEYIGLQNFTRLANNLVVRESLEFTLMFVFVSTLFQVVLGLAVAHLLNARFALRDVGRTISLIPWAIPMVVAAIGFRWMFDDDFGMIPDLIARLTGLQTSWLINPDNAQAAVIGVNIWKSTPFVALIFLAGLQGISEDLYEAAKVDGSTAWHSFWHITLPMLMPIIVSTTMYMLVWQLAIFDLTFAMTGGGPGFATTLFAQKIYVEINSLNYSFAAALSMVLVFVVSIIGMTGLYIFRRVEVSA